MFTGIIEATGVVEALERSPSGARLRVRAPEIAAALSIGSSIAVNGCCLTVIERGDGFFEADLSAETLHCTSFGEPAVRDGTQVNLEKPLAAGAPLGGHFVQGHVDGVGRVAGLVPFQLFGPIWVAHVASGFSRTCWRLTERSPLLHWAKQVGTALVAEGENWPHSSTDPPHPGIKAENEERGWWLSVRVPEPLCRYMAMKGSLAVDGISLTVARWQEGIADFAIIPFTYQHTNLKHLTIGDPVNLECDILAKYVERLLEARNEPAPTRLTIERLVEEGF